MGLLLDQMRRLGAPALDSEVRPKLLEERVILLIFELSDLHLTYHVPNRSMQAHLTAELTGWHANRSDIAGIVVYNQNFHMTPYGPVWA